MGQKNIVNLYLLMEELRPFLEDRLTLFPSTYANYLGTNMDVQVHYSAELLFDSKIFYLSFLPTSIPANTVGRDSAFKRGALCVRNMHCDPGFLLSTQISLLPEAIFDERTRKDCVSSFEDLRRQLTRITKVFVVRSRKGAVAYNVRISQEAIRFLEYGGELSEHLGGNRAKERTNGISNWYVSDLPGNPPIW